MRYPGRPFFWEELLLCRELPSVYSKPHRQDSVREGVRDYLQWWHNIKTPVHMEQILLAYGIPKETVAAITILYRNTKVKVRSPDGDTEYFDIVAGVLQGDTLAPYLFIICLDYVLRTSIDKIRENGFEQTKKRSRRYPTKTITDADYADDIAILANARNQAETLLHSLERAAAGIGLYVNAHKTEYMCYNQTGDISTLKWTPLKLVDKFTYLGSSVASTEKDIDTRLTKAWTAINRLSIIYGLSLT